MFIIAPDALQRRQYGAAWIAAHDGQERHGEFARIFEA